ncbi:MULTISPECIES: alpha/beta fold hydrolase [Hyphobacterium]|uniref:Alpha/beta fold hydrolase n=1 Tax=Hyphobacterium vulgare TaxID=1736751 RepID=A0ABV6ZVH8_9PROT
MSHTDAFFTSRDGLKISYRDHAPAGEETGLPVLCLHGLTRNLKDFEDFAPKVAATGRRVIAASQRGRGDSDRDPQTGRYHPGVYAQDMLDLLDHLGLPRAVFAGTSMGGLMTMVSAMLAPHRISAAIINDVGPELAPEGIERIRSYVGKSGDHDDWNSAADRAREVNGHAFPKETGADFWLTFAKRTHRVLETGKIRSDYDPAIASAVSQGGQAAVDLWPVWAAMVPIPTLLVRGGISDLLSRETMAKMKAVKPDLEVVEVPDVGHAPFLTEPAAWRAIAQFLERVD